MLETTDHAIRALCCRLEFGQEAPQDRLPFGGIETARQVPMFAVDLEITRVNARLLEGGHDTRCDRRREMRVCPR